ncbi:MAG: nucleotidyltransferase domain-containing protein [Promethearchaeota archaeon]
MEQAIFRELKSDFKEIALEPEIWGIMAYGSHVKGDNTIRSDIDVCVVAPKANNQTEIIHRIWQVVGGKYDVWLFEELALYLKAEIIQSHEIIYCKDIPALFEYFYQFQWQINDYKQRIRVAEKINKEPNP